MPELTYAQRLAAAVVDAEASLAMLRSIIQGASNAPDVATAGGNIKPVAKVIAEAQVILNAATAGFVNAAQTSATAAQGSADAAAASAVAAVAAVAAIGPATTTTAGVVELADDTEARAGNDAMRVVSPAQIASQTQKLAPQLNRWFRGGVAGKTAWFIGDSTTSNATYFFARLAYYQQPNQPLEGATLVNRGNNGASLSAFLDNSATYGIAAAIAAAADLYVFDYGINDVRLGATNQAQMEARIVTAIEALRAALPQACIVLRMPNPFLSTDPGSTGFISPLGSAATYSGYLRTSYRNLAHRWPDVVLHDTQRLVYGEVSPATSALMIDILHPAQLGQEYDADELVKLIGQPTPYRQALATEAKTTIYATPWTSYYRALENPNFYDRVYSGLVGDSGAGYIRLTLSDNRSAHFDIKKGDIIAPNGLLPFVNTATAANNRSSAGVVQVNMTSPVTLTQGMPIAVYRDRFNGDAVTLDYVQRTDSLPWRVRCWVSEAGTNYIRLSPYDLDGAQQLRQMVGADTLVVQGQAATLCTNAQFFTQNPTDPSSALWYVQLSGGTAATGDKSALVGKSAYVFGAVRRIVQLGAADALPAPGDMWLESAAVKARISGTESVVLPPLTIVDPKINFRHKVTPIDFNQSLNTALALADTTLVPAKNIDVGKRINIWQNSESVGSSSYTTTNSTKDGADTIVVGGITLGRFTGSNFYSNLRSQIGGLGLTPFVIGKRYLVSCYVVSLRVNDQFVLMRGLVDSSSQGHGSKFITGTMRRIWSLGQATSTSLLDLGPVAATVLGGSAGVDPVWVFMGGIATDPADPVLSVDMYIGGFQIELTSDTAKDGIAVIGDSTVQGSQGSIDGVLGISWVRFAAGFSNATWFNRGIGGNRTSDMVARYAADITPLAVRCKYVVIQGGPNDFANNVTVATVQTNVASMVASAKVDGMIPIVCTCTPSISITGANETNRQTYNAWVRTTYGLIFDLAKVVEDPMDPAQWRRDVLWTSDGVHPNFTAMRAMATHAVSQNFLDLPRPGPYQPIVAATFNPPQLSIYDKAANTTKPLSQLAFRDRWVASSYRTRSVTPIPLMVIGPMITRGVPGVASLTGTLVPPTSSIYRYGGAYWAVAGGSYPDNMYYLALLGAGRSSIGSGCIEFMYLASAFEIFVKEFAGTGFRVWVNGELAALDLLLTSNSPGSLVYYKVDFGTTAWRQIKVEFSGQFYWGGVVPKNAASAIYPITTPRQPRVIVMGDSYVYGTGALYGQALSGFPKILGSIMDWDVWSSGIGSSGWLVANTIRGRLATDVYPHVPDIVIFSAGHNDTAYTANQIQTEVALVLAGMATNLPNTKVYVIGPLFQTSPAAAQIIAIRDGMSAAALAAGVPFADPVLAGSEWITAATNPTFISGDGVHPSTDGHYYYGHRFASAIMAIEGML